MTVAAAAFDPVPSIAKELTLPPASVAAVVKLLAEGATVPFIARYRKEATGGLDEVQIRNVEERRTYLVELEARRESVLAEIQKQGKLTPELEKKILGVATKAELEDLYLPYKPKRRTRAMIARERGLEPLAELVWSQPLSGSPAEAALAFVSAEKEVPDAAAALAGARDICAERAAEDAELRKHARELYVKQATISVGKTSCASCSSSALNFTGSISSAEYAINIGTKQKTKYSTAPMSDPRTAVRSSLALVMR